uniref:Immunoglobulin V-set domain-containing protein n=1 Tax=Callorhinchus milii TaxID=7868 RepID=A0A4W3GP22_CALMI
LSLCVSHSLSVCLTLSLSVSHTLSQCNAVVVVGTLGDTVQLPSPRGLSPEIDSVMWSHTSTAQKLAEYRKGKTEYYGTEEMRKRVTVHRENLTLQISDLRRTDTGVYRISIGSLADLYLNSNYSPLPNFP